MHEDRFHAAVSMTCGDCGSKLGTTERGSECPKCKMWPLCESCAVKHIERTAR